MAKRKLSKADKAFYGGILTALAILRIHDQQTIFDEVVGTTDVKELVRYAKEENEMEWSGLADYGYSNADK
jgi:hypothetical protein